MVAVFLIHWGLLVHSTSLLPGYWEPGRLVGVLLTLVETWKKVCPVQQKKSNIKKQYLSTGFNTSWVKTAAFAVLITIQQQWHYNNKLDITYRKQIKFRLTLIVIVLHLFKSSLSVLHAFIVWNICIGWQWHCIVCLYAKKYINSVRSIQIFSYNILTCSLCAGIFYVMMHCQKCK